MTVFITLLLTGLTIAFVAYPLFRRSSRPDDAAEPEKLRELSSSRDTTYSMLKELEFDFQSGLLTEDDYRDLEARYKKKAISILRNIDDVKEDAEVEEEIEDEIEKQVIKLRQSRRQFCPQCGARREEDARFCSHCGTTLG